MIELTKLTPLLQVAPKYIELEYSDLTAEMLDLTFRDQDIFQKFKALCEVRHIQNRKLKNRRGTFEKERAQNSDPYALRLRINKQDFKTYIAYVTDIDFSKSSLSLAEIINLLAMKMFVRDTIVLYQSIAIETTKQLALIYQYEDDAINVLFVENEKDKHPYLPKLTFSNFDAQTTTLRDCIKIINCNNLNYNSITKFNDFSTKLNQDIDKIVDAVNNAQNLKPIATNKGEEK